MQFLLSILLALAPLAVIATPVAETGPAAPTPIATGDAPVAVAGRSPDEIFSRSPQSCAIVSNDGTVNCRTGPGYDYDANYTVNDGDIYVFQCYKRGDCYNGNWSVLQLREEKIPLTWVVCWQHLGQARLE
jgi:hypothetical protein